MPGGVGSRTSSKRFRIVSPVRVSGWVLNRCSRKRSEMIVIAAFMPTLLVSSATIVSVEWVKGPGAGLSMVSGTLISIDSVASRGGVCLPRDWGRPRRSDLLLSAGSMRAPGTLWVLGIRGSPYFDRKFEFECWGSVPLVMDVCSVQPWGMDQTVLNSFQIHSSLLHHLQNRRQNHVRCAAPRGGL